MPKRPIYLGSIEGKTVEELTDEAWAAIQQLQAAKEGGEDDGDEEE
jgi:hypothetical protein